MVKKEIQKLLDVGFIYPIEHTDWASPIVIARKKNGKIKVCVDFKKVDGFSGYNHIVANPKDQHKMAFSTIWGVYAFKKMLFGLTNAPSTWQRFMSTSFRKFLRDFLEVFLDDLCVHSAWR